MIIAFSGHRDKFANPGDLMSFYGRHHKVGDRWIHGGARGFDSQVNALGKRLGVDIEVFRPDYEKWANNPRYAPIDRNHHMVDICDLLVVLWDGREYGGTYDTIKYAMEKHVPIIFFGEGGI